MLHQNIIKAVSNNCFCYVARKSAARGISFGPLQISETISQKLQEKNIDKPTEIQEKAMESILNRKDVIINSETGSGKTLCYLVPLLEQLKQSQKTFQSKIISTSRALIFAPNMELVHQIGNVCSELGQVDFSLACSGSPLCVKDNTQLIITIPTFVMNYQWQSIKNITSVVFDEADLLFVDQFDEVRKLLEFYTGRKTHFSRKERLRQKVKEAKKKYVFHQASEKPQFVFVGATIPPGGRKSVLSLIERFVPGARLMQSSMAHKAIKNVNFEYIEVEDDFDVKVTALTVLLEEESREMRVASSRTAVPAEDTSCNRMADDNIQAHLRAIVYVNKVDDAKKVFEELTKDDAKYMQSSKYFTKEYSTQKYAHEENTDGDADGKRTIGEFRKTWKNNVCLLHGDIGVSERLDVLDGFATGKYNVLITTDLAARGLDIPNVDVIIQFDIASNVVGILHRAGRTARAGAKGKVVSFLTEKNQDLYRMFSSMVEKDDDVTKLFSRRRRLRRRIKEGAFSSPAVACD